MKGLVLENINIVEKENALVVQSNQTGKITLFWNEIETKNINLIIEENVNLDLIEINEKEDAELNIDMKPYSNVHHNVFSSNNTLFNLVSL